MITYSGIPIVLCVHVIRDILQKPIPGFFSTRDCQVFFCMNLKCFLYFFSFSLIHYLFFSFFFFWCVNFVVFIITLDNSEAGEPRITLEKHCREYLIDFRKYCLKNIFCPEPELCMHFLAIQLTKAY